MTAQSNTAVLLLAHGTPERVGQIPEYLRNVTGGRELPQAVIDEIAHRYAAIGSSPLTRLTVEQAKLLQQRIGLPVYVGMRNWAPYISDAMAQMRADGIAHAQTICLAPQNSRTSTGLYRKAVEASAGDMEIDFINSWHDHPLLVKAFAERLQSARGGNPAATVIFTAHSVPCRTIAAGDPYGVQTRETARRVAEAIALHDDEWVFAFQSQGMSGGPWIGPTVEETLSSLHDAGVTHVIVQPIGFLCDHVEVLYDVDVLFRQRAESLGMKLTRTESLNDSPLLTEALADVAQARLKACV
jgi:ferrochelatase